MIDNASQAMGPVNPYQYLWTVERAPLPEPQQAEPKAGEQQAAAPPVTGTGPLLDIKDMRLLANRGLTGEEQDAYESILAQFASDPANREDPVAFLRTLSSEGIDLLKKAQSLPGDAVVTLDGAGREEALNLILPFSQQVDLDNDGFNEGITGGKGWRFPPINAPQSVKDSWEKATEGLSEKDQMLFQGLFLVDMISQNIKRDADGTPIGVYGPDDPEFRNPFADPNFDYEADAEWHLANLEKERYLMSDDKYAWEKDLFTRWRDALSGSREEPAVA